MVDLTRELSPIVISITYIEHALAEKYRKGILRNEINDPLHIATSPLAQLDAIVSWNFRHLVNLETMRTINQINLIEGLKIIEIVSPENLGGDQYGSL